MRPHTVHIFLLLLPPSCWTTEVQQLGCMVPLGYEKKINQQRNSDWERQKAKEVVQKKSSFKTVAGESSAMTIQVCIERCWIKRHTFAALQAGFRCFCANSETDLIIVDSSLCHERCLGNSRQRCGGLLALSVYSIGYSPGPLLQSVELSKGLLGCYLQDVWTEMCRHPAGFSSDAILDREISPQTLNNAIRAAHKVPLVTPRMSALLCATYCVGRPRSLPLAILQTNDTCCCGRSLSDALERNAFKVDFGQFCSAPCADVYTRPNCVGHWMGSNYVSVYNTLDIWPAASSRPKAFSASKSDLRLVFPDDNFEETALYLKWEDSEQDELLGVQVYPSKMPVWRLVEDPNNLAPYAKVVDEPSDGSEEVQLIWILIFATLIFVSLASSGLYLVISRRKQTHVGGGKFRSMNTTGNHGTSTAQSLGTQHSKWSRKDEDDDIHDRSHHAGQDSDHDGT